MIDISLSAKMPFVISKLANEMISDIKAKTKDLLII